MAAPALTVTPTARACEPVHYFCPFYGFMYGCWPGVVVDCAEEALRP